MNYSAKRKTVKRQDQKTAKRQDQKTEKRQDLQDLT